MIIYTCIWIRYIFVRNYDFIYMIMDNLTMSWFWYPNQWRLFIGTLMLFIGTLIPSQWGLFIGTLIPKPVGVIHWFWYLNQWGLFIGTLIPLFIGTLISKPMGVIHWYSDTQPMGVIHWYSDTQTNGGYSLVLWYSS